MGILIKGMDEIPEDGAVLVVKHDNGKAYIKHACTYGYSMELVKLPAVQPDHNADVSKRVDVDDCISRRHVIDAMKDMYRAAEKWLRDATDDVTKARAESCMATLMEIKLRIDKTMGKGTLTDDDCMEAAKSVLGEDELPAVQPATNCSEIPNKSDTISRKAAIDALDIAIERYDEIAEKYRKKADIERNDYMDMRDNAYEAQQLAQWLNELKYLREKIEQLTIKPEQRWIPCSERLPEHGGRYLVSVLDGINRRTTVAPYMPRCKAWTMTGRMTYWKVIAWMPLPASYKGE